MQSFKNKNSYGQIDIGCHVYLSGDQTVSNTTTETVEFDTLSYDPSNSFDIATYKWTCPVEGIYQILHTARVDNVTADKYANAFIMKNTSIIAQSKVYSNGATYEETNTITIQYHFDVGDTIHCEVYHNSGGDEVLSGNMYDTFMNIMFMGQLANNSSTD